jgi:hypothetical protein
VDNAAHWYAVTNASSLTGFTPGNQLVYRVLFSSAGRTIGFDNMNITWSY